MLIKSLPLFVLGLSLIACNNTQSLNSKETSQAGPSTEYDGTIENVDARCEQIYTEPPFRFVEGIKTIDHLVMVPDKGIYALGSAYTGQGRDGDLRLIHFDAKLNELWRKEYESNSVEWGKDLLFAQDHLYSLATRFINGKGDNEIYVLKTDLAGERVWSITGGTPGYDVGIDLEFYQDELLVVGRNVLSDEINSFVYRTDGKEDSMQIFSRPETNLESFIQPYGEDKLLVASIIADEQREKWLEISCFDSDFSELWNRKVVDLSGDNPQGKMLIDQQGNIYLMGHLGVSEYGYQILIAKLNSAAETEWIKTYGLFVEGQSMGRIDMGQFMIEGQDGSIMIGGNTGSLIGTGINYVFSIDATGAAVWAKAYVNPNGYLTSAAYDQEAQSYVLGGYFRRTLSSDEISQGFLLPIDLQGQPIE
ncbi:MAG: hypothetical protein AAF927_21710 [Bacteroidota bacterium]